MPRPALGRSPYLYTRSIMTTCTHSDLASKQERLAGAELLAFIEGNPTMSKLELCLGAGYIRQGPGSLSGTQMAAFTDFYEAIMDAKGIDPERNAFADGAWFDKLCTQDKDLYEMIEERCPEFTKLSGEQCQEFMDKLSELGITTSSQFEGAYFAQFDYAHDESHYGEFCEYLHTEVNCLEVPEYLVVDWMSSWYRNFRYDFSDLEFDGTVYFFHNHF